MESENNLYKCNKCNGEIAVGSKLLHDQFCRELILNEEMEESNIKEEINIQNEEKEEINVNNNIPTKETYKINLDVQYPTLDEIFFNKKQYSNSIDYRECVICQNYYTEEEWEDHLMCHNLDDVNNNESKEINK